MAFTHATSTTRLWTVRCNNQYLSAYSDPHDPAKFTWTQRLDRCWLSEYDRWVAMGWPEEMLWEVETTITSHLIK